MSASPEIGVLQLSDMTGGWFVGDFAPAALRCAGAEVAVKRYAAGDTEESHEHRIATEVTLLLEGRAVMCGRLVSAGEILVLPPGTATAFVALSDCTTVVVKTPSVLGDKHAAADPFNTLSKAGDSGKSGGLPGTKEGLR